jgi:hypothetical protein
VGCSHVDLALESLKDGLKRVVLDTRDLKVTAVAAIPGGPLQVMPRALTPSSWQL